MLEQHILLETKWQNSTQTVFELR